ncbi:MAG TPA: MFS transporter [Gemmataceae bacterium]|nr:MFS transporter [Gemmataceae bacterium]
MSTSPTPAARRLTLTAWLIVIIAAIGFAFDTYELLMAPLILRPAVSQMIGIPPTDPGFRAAVGDWRALMFYVPAVCGGVFGLLGGYLTDRYGRRRVLTWSIMLYSGSAFLAGFSTSLPMLLFFRCTTFVGVCVEFVAAIAWLAELFPEPHQRERVLGYTQAFSSFGGLLVAVANSLAFQHAHDLPAVVVPQFLTKYWGAIAPDHAHEAWRYTLMSGLIPALPLLLIRPFLPESPVWRERKTAGTLKRPSISELFAPAYFRTTIVTTIMFACSYGVAFGAIQQIPDIVPGLADVKAEVSTATAGLSGARSRPKAQEIEQKAAPEYVEVQEVGGLIGRFLLALLAVRIVSRQNLLRVFQVPALFVVPLVFFFFLRVENRHFFDIPIGLPGLEKLRITTVTLGVGLAGLFTVAQFSFWGNYLPRVYPVHLRGTGESFAANIGGRMIGSSFAALTNLVATRDFVPGTTAPHKLAVTAAAVAFSVTIVGFLMSYALPEPPADLKD